jgi:hypothetical protein
VSRSRSWPRLCCRLLFRCLLAVAFVGGCSLFEPRDPEAPSGDSAVWEVPRTPTTVVGNMEASFRSGGVDYYMRCFDSTMVFEADPLAEVAYPGVFDDWGWDEEEETTRNLLADLSPDHPPDSLLVLQMAVDLDDSHVGEAEATLEVDYLLDAWLASAPERFEAGGRLTLQLAKGDDQLWSVTWWGDEADSSGWSWSMLKGRYHL